MFGRSIKDILDQSIAETQIRTEFSEIGHLSTGMSSLDTAMGPTLDGGRLWVVAGGSGSGKTAFVAQEAITFARQTPLLWFSLEDDPIDLIRRPIAAMSGEDITSLRSGFEHGMVPQGVHESAREIAQLPISIVEDRCDVIGMVGTIHDWCRRVGGGPMPRVVIVDQLSHILETRPSEELRKALQAHGIPDPPRHDAQETKRLEWISEVLRWCAVKFNLLILLAHQLNDVRDDDSKPTQESIRGSRGIVHKADHVSALWRPKTIQNPAWVFSNKLEPPRIPNHSGRTWIVCLKARAASRLDVEVRWDGDRQLFTELGSKSQRLALPRPMSDRAIEGYHALAELRSKHAAITHTRANNQPTPPRIDASRNRDKG